MSSDENAYELGTRFTTSEDGLASGVGFYKGSSNTGTHVGRLWNATTRQLLDTVTFTSETASGWQTALFDNPVPLAAGQAYVVSYSVPIGYYAFAGFERRGLMRAGLSLVARHAFRQLKLHRLEANIQPDNLASIALVRRCGFQLEGYSPRYLKIGGRWRDHERWAVLADKY